MPSLRRRNALPCLGIILAAVVGPISGSASAVPGDNRVAARINDALATGAPTSRLGGIFGPYVDCGASYDDVVATGTVTSQATGASENFDWDFSGPAPYVFRGPAGAYVVNTNASCAGGTVVTRTQVVVIEQKTARTTMSSAEFKQIKTGMTQRKVKRIIGYKGRSGGKYAGTVARTYDSMPFWSYSSVTFRGGRVVAKSYDFDHD